MKTVTLDSPDLSQIYFDKNCNLIKYSGIINDYYICHRPCSRIASPFIGCLDIHSKDYERKKLISNYGHVGGGWTMNFASAEKAIQYIDIDEIIKNKEKIAVIGSGIISFTTISLLIEKGVEPSSITIYTKSLDLKDSAAFGSGAIFSCQVRDPCVRPDFDDLILDSFKKWKSFKDKKDDKSRFPWHKLTDHYYLIDFYTGAEKEVGLIDSNSGLDSVIQAGLVPPIEYVYVTFKNSSVKHKCKKIRTYLFNTFNLLYNFQDSLCELGVNFVQKTINDPANQIEENIIFACAGAGIRNLHPAFKEAAFGLTGHMIYTNELKEDKKKNLDYILLSKYKETKDSETKYFVYMPKKGLSRTGVIGSSKIPEYYGGNKELDRENYRDIVERARAIYGQNYPTPKPKF